MPKAFRTSYEELNFLGFLLSQNFPFTANTLPSKLVLIGPENTET